MNAKLTLSLDKETIERAKAYAIEHGTSVSKLVENFIKMTTANTRKKETSSIEISDFVKSLAVAGLKPRSKSEMRKEYGEYLNEKYTTND